MAKPASKKKNQYMVNSLAKGLKVLEVFAAERRPLSLTELAEIMGINHTSAIRMCSSLCDLGFLRKDRQKLYHLAPKVLTLGFAALQTLNWREVAEIRLKRLYDLCQETVNMAILQGTEVLYLIRLRKEKYLPWDLQVGSTLPVHCTAMGKVLMAFSPPECTESIWSTIEIKKMGPRTISSLKNFRAAVEETRKRGFAVNDEELFVGVRTVAVPVFGKGDSALAAINISVATKRHSQKEMLKEMLPPLHEAAAELSQILKDMSLTHSDIVQP